MEQITQKLRGFSGILTNFAAGMKMNRIDIYAEQ